MGNVWHLGKIQQKRKSVVGFVKVTLDGEADTGLMSIDMPETIWTEIEARFGKEGWKDQAIYWCFEPTEKLYLGGWIAFDDAPQEVHEQWKINSQDEMFRLFGVPVVT